MMNLNDYSGINFYLSITPSILLLSAYSLVPELVSSSSLDDALAFAFITASSLALAAAAAVTASYSNFNLLASVVS